MTFLAVAVLAYPEPAAAEDELPALLDVDRRVTTLRLIEVHPFVGTLVGDKLHSSVQTGGRLDFRLTPRVSLGGLLAWSPVEVDSDSALGRVLVDDQLLVAQSVFAFHLPGAFLMEEWVAEMDVCGQLGAGLTRLNGDSRGSLFVGGAAKVYFDDWTWFGLRGDIGTHMSTVQTAEGPAFSSDFSLSVGPIFRLPPDLPRGK